MEKQNHSLNERELGRKDCVESNGEHDDRNRQEGTMISVPNVVGFVEGYEALDDTASHKGNTAKVSLPANQCEPTWKMLEPY